MASSARPIVVVVGMHRSGTSLCSHLLTRLGYDMADEPIANKSNPKGHWERMEIVKFHDRILKHFDRDYYSPHHAFVLPPGWWSDAEVQNIRNQLIIWLRERMGNIARFGFKDPRMCLMFPLWKEIFAELNLEPIYIFCVRNPIQVARSIGDRDQFDSSDSEYRWVRYNAHAIAGIGDDETAFIPYDHWFDDPCINLDRVIRHLRSPWQPGDPSLVEAVSDVIAPELRHDRASGAMMARPFARGFYRMLLESVQENRSTSNLRLAATNFIAIEQLHAHRQTAYTVLARDQVAQKSANEALQKTSAQLNVRLQALQTVLENEKTSRAKTDEELVAIKAAAASAQEQARVAEAARLKELASVKTAADAAQEQARAAEAARMKELASIKAAADAAKEEARLAEAALAAANREIERLRAAHAVSPVPNPQEIQAIPAPAT